MIPNVDNNAWRYRLVEETVELKCESADDDEFVEGVNGVKDDENNSIGDANRECRIFGDDKMSIENDRREREKGTERKIDRAESAIVSLNRGIRNEDKSGWIVNWEGKIWFHVFLLRSSRSFSSKTELAVKGEKSEEVRQGGEETVEKRNAE